MKMYLRNDKSELCCPFCDKKEDHANTLYYHIKRDHEKNFDHECKYCDYKTYSKSLVDQHIKNKHPENLAKHTNSENLLRNYACPFCETKSANKGNIKTHIARSHAPWIEVHKPNKACQCCGTQQKSATAYYYHSLTCIQPPNEYTPVYEQIQKAIK